MYYKRSKKSVLENCVNVRSCEYFEIENLLAFDFPTSYNSGVHGFNFDVYEFKGLTICRGYRNLPSKKLKNCREYDEKALAILKDDKLSFEECECKIRDLVREFIKINKS